MEINYNEIGSIFNIQRFSLNDGPGIRTIVFLKGCPLHCQWCSNPESQNIKPVLLYDATECIHCGNCSRICKVHAIGPENPNFIDYDRCVGCGNCVDGCPVSALSLKGRIWSVQDIIRELKKEEAVFRRSGGGITLSGGEALVQFEFATELLKACKAQGWNTAMETAAYAPLQAIEMVLPYVDVTLLDIKHMNPDKHEKFVGHSNDVILRNAPRIAALSQVIVRVPVIPTFNYSEPEILDIARYAKTLPHVKEMHLLPYHSLGEKKYTMMGREYEMDTLGIKPLSEKDLEPYKRLVESQGLTCVIGG